MLSLRPSAAAFLVGFTSPCGGSSFDSTFAGLNPLPAHAPDLSETADGTGNFLMISDWGNPFHPGQNDGMKECWGPHWKCLQKCGRYPPGEEGPKYCTIGSDGYEEDEYSQLNVAKHMAEWAKKYKAQFVINGGDSFYPGGVKSADDPDFQYIFEDRYPDKELQIPWLGILGNHDYGGFQCFFDVEKQRFARADPQFDYDTEKDWEWPQPKKRRWIMPDHYYKKRITFGHVSLDLFFVDTNYLDDHDGPLACGQGEIKIPPACTGEAYNGCKKYCEDLGKKQGDWLVSELPKSDATWKFLIGHHPLTFFLASLDTLPHGPTFPGGSNAFFLNNNISAYFCGHVHGMEQAWYKPTATGGWSIIKGGTTIPGALFEMQNGAGGGSYPDSSFNGARWGFTGVELKKDSVKITYFSEKRDPAVINLAAACIQNYPDKKACPWLTGNWSACEDGNQTREVSCFGGNEEHCEPSAKPDTAQGCAMPTPPPTAAPTPGAGPSPGPNSGSSGMSTTTVVVVGLVIAVAVAAIGGAVWVVRSRQRHGARGIRGAAGNLDVSMQDA